MFSFDLQAGIPYTPFLKKGILINAIWKVVLAHQDREFLDQFLKSVELKRYTPTTLTDPISSREHLNEVKAQGYAIDVVDHEPELKSIPAPVKDP